MIPSASVLYLNLSPEDEIAYDYKTHNDQIENNDTREHDHEGANDASTDEEELAFFQEELEALCGQRVYPLSAVSGQGISEVLRALKSVIDNTYRKEKKNVKGEVAWQP